MSDEWNDPRAKWLEQWVLNTTKLKSDKWKKLVGTEESKYVDSGCPVLAVLPAPFLCGAALLCCLSLIVPLAKRPPTHLWRTPSVTRTL